MRRAVLLALFAALLTAGAGCSRTTQLSADGSASTTFRVTDEDDSRSGNVSGSSESAAQMRLLIDRLLASDDPCAILTQRDIRDIQLDPTAMASVEVRQVVAAGVVDVYDHLAQLVTEPTVNAALVVQRDTFVQVLSVVERYSNAPISDAASAEIATLAQAPAYVAAETAVNQWVGLNCR